MEQTTSSANSIAAAPAGSLDSSPIPAPVTTTLTGSSGLRRPTKKVHSLLGVQILSSGSYAPDNVVTNEDLQARYGFDPEWIIQRTGIRERRWCPPEMATSDMSVLAAERAIKMAGVNQQDIDLVIVGTLSSDYSFPSTACLVQDRLGLDAAAFDLQAGCSGFVYTMTTAAQFVASGSSKLALAIGADCCSRLMNVHDQKTAPLFGDGAGAVLISRGDPHQGLICYQLGADGGGGEFIYRPACGSRKEATPDAIAAGLQYLHMDGRNVFKWAVRTVTETIELMLHKTGMSVHDVSLFLLHQANMRIIDSVAEQLGIPKDKMVNNLDRYGNTSAGSVPLVLDEAMQAGRIKRGDVVLMCGFGTGLTWGTGLFRW
ncbi:MAG: beta-ketoacyl-ACP synthase III [Planctomycetales bacterium]